MGITSLQVCMDSSDDWLQGSISEEGADQTSSEHDILIACSGTLMERRLRPQHEQSPKCPRCDSTHTKFCYYNNYSLSQPRYFCKTCRRYWTKGGTLRNIPVGGGCRKNKKTSSTGGSKKNNSNNAKSNINDDGGINNGDSSVGLLSHSPGAALLSPSSSSLVPPPSAFSSYNYLNNLGNNPNASGDYHRSFLPEMPFAPLSSSALGFLTCDATNPIFVLENNPTPINFMVENKYDGAFAGGGQDYNMGMHGENFDGLMASYNNANLQAMGLSTLDQHGISMTSAVSNENAMVDNFQRMMMPYDQSHHHLQHHITSNNQIQEIEEDVKPISSAKVLPLEWQDYNHHHHHLHLHNHRTTATTEIKDQSFGYNLGGLGSWTSLMNGGHGSSAANPLV